MDARYCAASIATARGLEFSRNISLLTGPYSVAIAPCVWLSPVCTMRSAMVGIRFVLAHDAPVLVDKELCVEQRSRVLGQLLGQPNDHEHTRIEACRFAQSSVSGPGITTEFVNSFAARSMLFGLNAG